MWFFGRAPTMSPRINFKTWVRRLWGRLVTPLLTRHIVIILSSLYYLLSCYCRRKRRHGRLLYDKILYCALYVNATARFCFARTIWYFEYFDCNIIIILSIIHVVAATPTCLFFINIYAYIANVSGWWENSAGARGERDGEEEL